MGNFCRRLTRVSHPSKDLSTRDTVKVHSLNISAAKSCYGCVTQEPNIDFLNYLKAVTRVKN